MTKGQLIISAAEKLRAGLGGAGMAAVAVEALGRPLLGSAFSGVGATVAPVVAACLAGAAAFYYAEVSPREAALMIEAAKEG